jgi:hypothetical protein
MITHELEQLVANLYVQDAANGPVQPDGRKAYAGWLAASFQHGDCLLNDVLFAIRPRDFAAAWEAKVAEDAR